AADAVRVKGDPGVVVQLAVKRGDQVWQHREEVPLRPGDRLMLALNSDAGYVSLLGRDVAGHITTYYDALPTEAEVYAESWKHDAPIAAAHTLIRLRKDTP